MTGRDADLLAAAGLPPDATTEDVRALRDRLTAYLDATDPAPADDAPPTTAADLSDVLVDDDGGAPVPPSGATAARPTRRMVPVLAALVVVGVVLGVYFMGGAPTPTTQAAPTPAPTAQQLLDTARVAELEEAVAADPTDVEAMRELGALHHQAEEYEAAAEWQQRIVDRDPEDVDARLALGVALFSIGDVAGAEEHWGRAAELAPDLAEVHYNLGFLYLSMDPPQVERAEEAWGRVIELDPESSLAQTAAAHLESLLGDTTGD